MKNISILSFALFITIFVASCSEGPLFWEDDFSTVPAPYDTTTAERIIRPNGLIIYIHSEGMGDFRITERDRVMLYYTFRLKDGSIVQSTWANGNLFPTEFTMATTIRGFREGLLGAKQGERRTLVIPPSLGYGDSQSSPYRSDTLYYDVLIDTIIE